MPREEKQFCGRCSHLLAPARRKRAQTGERLGVKTVDYGRVCMKCIDRHGLTPVNENTPTPTPAPAPAPAVALDAAQAALDALPEWLKRDGAAHGRDRLEVAADEAAGKNGTKATATRVTVPAPVARDTKENPKPARPVRRPARPRREASPTALAALAPASDTYDMAALDRIHGTQTGAPAPRPWAQEMPGPAAPTRKAVTRIESRPKSASTAAQRRVLALAYARKHGADAVPTSRPPIVTAEEIRTGMRTLPVLDDTALRYHPDVVLDRWEAAKYVGHTIRTLDRYTQEGCISTVDTARGGKGYLVADLDDYRAGRPTRSTPKPKPAARVNSSKDRLAAARGVAAKLKREQAKAHVETFGQLLREGKDPETAATEAGYANLLTARQACRRLGREDIRQLVPDRRRRTEERAA